MSDVIENSLGVVKILAAKAYVIAGAAAFILFAPGKLLIFLHVEQFAKDYEGWIGATLILSIAFIFADLLVWVRGDKNKNEKTVAKKSNDSADLLILSELTKDEKEYLKEFIEHDKSQVQRDISDGISHSLIAKGIVMRPAQISHEDSFVFLLNPWARRLLKKHPSLLDI